MGAAVLALVMGWLVVTSPALAQSVGDTGVQLDEAPAIQLRRTRVLPEFEPRGGARPVRAVRIVGALSRDVVEDALRPHRVALAMCRASEAELRLVVAEDGSVTTLEVLSAEPEEVDCLTEAIDGLVFPALDDDGMAVVWVPVGR